MSQSDIHKKNAASRAVEFIRDGMTVGLGSGSTAHLAVQMIAQKIDDGLNIQAVSSSKETTQLAEERGIKISDYQIIDHLDVNIDGADEVDNHYNLIKGGGGALLREKINARFAHTNVIVVDPTKMVQQLGHFPLPVEVNPFGHQQLKRFIEQQYGINAFIRSRGDEYFITDNGNYIIDCNFTIIDNPQQLENELLGIPGLIETGLFINLTHILVIGREADATVIDLRSKVKPS